MKGVITIAYLKEIEDLGEFKFIFSKTPVSEIREGYEKYFLEIFWIPKNCIVADLLDGYYLNFLDAEIARWEEEAGMDIFIDMVEGVCKDKVENANDIYEIYTDILLNYFEYSPEDISRLITEDDSPEEF